MADTLLACDMDNLVQIVMFKEYIAKHFKLYIQAPPTISTNGPCAWQTVHAEIEVLPLQTQYVWRCCTIVDTYTEVCNAEDNNRARNCTGQFDKDGKRLH